MKENCINKINLIGIQNKHQTTFSSDNLLFYQDVFIKLLTQQFSINKIAEQTLLKILSLLIRKLINNSLK